MYSTSATIAGMYAAAGYTRGDTAARAINMSARAPCWSLRPPYRYLSVTYGVSPILAGWSQYSLFYLDSGKRTLDPDLLDVFSRAL